MYQYDNNRPRKNENHLKVVVTVSLVLGIISYAIGTVPSCTRFWAVRTK